MSRRRLAVPLLLVVSLLLTPLTHAQDRPAQVVPDSVVNAVDVSDALRDRSRRATTAKSMRASSRIPASAEATENVIRKNPYGDFRAQTALFLEAREAYNQQEVERVLPLTDSLLAIGLRIPQVYSLKALALARNDPEAALPIARKGAEDADPSSYFPHWAYAEMLRRNDRAEESVRVMDRFLNNNLQNLRARETRVDYLLFLERHQEAAEELETILSYEPYRYSARLTLSEVYHRMERVEEAHAQIDEVLRYKPNWSRPYEYRASHYAREGHYEDALDALNKQISLARADGQTVKQITDRPFVNRAFMRVQFDSLDAAERDIETALSYQDFRPEPNAFLYRSRALLRLERDRGDAACRDLQRALDLGYNTQFTRWGRYGPDVQVLFDEHCSDRDVPPSRFAEPDGLSEDASPSSSSIDPS